MKLTELLLRKDNAIIQVPPATPVLEAVRRMVKHNVGAVLVVDNGHIRGIFTERDHLRATATGNPDPGEAIIDDYMIQNPVVALPGDSIERAMATMTEARVRHLPVMDGDRLLGVVSMGDVVKAVASERATELSHLRDYITGGAPEIASLA